MDVNRLMESDFLGPGQDFGGYDIASFHIGRWIFDVRRSSLTTPSMVYRETVRIHRQLITNY